MDLNSISINPYGDSRLKNPRREIYFSSAIENKLDQIQLDPRELSSANMYYIVTPKTFDTIFKWKI